MSHNTQKNKTVLIVTDGIYFLCLNRFNTKPYRNGAIKLRKSHLYINNNLGDVHRTRSHSFQQKLLSCVWRQSTEEELKTSYFFPEFMILAKGNLSTNPLQHSLSGPVSCVLSQILPHPCTPNTSSGARGEALQEMGISCLQNPKHYTRKESSELVVCGLRSLCYCLNQVTQIAN